MVGLDVKRLYALTFGLGAACVGAAGSMLVLIIDVTPSLGPDATGVGWVYEYALVDDTGRALLWRRYRLHSAHRLPNVPPGHKCGRVHGHGFEIASYNTSTLIYRKEQMLTQISPNAKTPVIRDAAPAGH